MRTLNRVAVAATAVALCALAGCGDDGGTSGANTTSATSEATPTTESSDPAASAVTEACPLVDLAVVTANYSVQNPTLTEREPAKTGPATTYACDLSDEAGEMFLTAAITIGPRSGTAEANLRAALSDKEGEPVDGLGEVGGYAETDGVATAAGIKSAGADQWMVVAVHGAAGSKQSVVAVAQDLAQKV